MSKARLGSLLAVCWLTAAAWAQDTSASFSTLIPNSTFRATTVTGAATKSFYRVKGTY